MTARNFKGEKYTKGYQTSADLAKAIRTDIAIAKKGTILPKTLKVSVRKNDYSMGRSITINIKQLPEGMNALHPEYVKWMKANPNGYRSDFLDANLSLKSHLSLELMQIIKTLKKLGNAYNYDNSDVMTDYFDVDYYLQIESYEVMEEK